jgi:tripartite-type tricarboxylate transporter receptor subunit TctC
MRLFAAALAGLLFLVQPMAARADEVADFFKGKTVTIYIGYGVGGAYDLYARMLARYLPKHIPGAPTVLPVNMPGASSMVLGNYLARIAPRDGTAVGAVNAALIFDPLFAGAASKAQFKGPDMTMIANAVSAAAVLFSWKTSGVTTFDDLKTKDLLIGAMTKTGDTYVLPAALKAILNLDHLKIITGYPGTREAVLALERGEIMGRVWDMEGIRSTRPQWLEDGSIHILAQLAPKRMPEVPASVPLARDLVPDEQDRKVLDTVSLTTLMARPYIAPPGIPPARVKALRAAFMATMHDPEYLADMKKAQANVQPMSGEEMQRYVADAYALPEPLIKRVRAILSQ